MFSVSTDKKEGIDCVADVTKGIGRRSEEEGEGRRAGGTCDERGGDVCDEENEV